MEAEDEQVCTHIQDTEIRMLEAGQDFGCIEELCDTITLMSSVISTVRTSKLQRMILALGMQINPSLQSQYCM